MKKIILVFLPILIGPICISAQSGNNLNTDKITINTEFEISLKQSTTLSDTYVLDISNINFNSKDGLYHFCKIFSFDFYTLIGNFEKKKIDVVFDQVIIKNRNWTVKNVNQHFKDISKRMIYIYNQINK